MTERRATMHSHSPTSHDRDIEKSRFEVEQTKANLLRRSGRSTWAELPPPKTTIAAALMLIGGIIFLISGLVVFFGPGGGKN